MQWLNEPLQWHAEGDQIVVRSGAKTDFWRKTHNDAITNNGHFYYQTMRGDFTAEVQVIGQYGALYDQAGLMLRMDDETWLKTGIEYLDGVQHASVVVTRDFSDWSVVPLNSPASFWLRLRRYGHTVEIDYSLDSSHFVMLRQAYFPPAESVQIGVMCAAPTGDGFDVVFQGLKIQGAS